MRKQHKYNVFLLLVLLHVFSPMHVIVARAHSEHTDSVGRHAREAAEAEENEEVTGKPANEQALEDSKRTAPKTTYKVQRAESEIYLKFIIGMVGGVLMICALVTMLVFLRIRERRKIMQLMENPIKTPHQFAVMEQCDREIDPDLRPSHLDPKKIKFDGPLNIHNKFVGKDKFKHRTDVLPDLPLRNLHWVDNLCEAVEIGSLIEKIMVVSEEDECSTAMDSSNDGSDKNLPAAKKKSSHSKKMASSTSKGRTAKTTRGKPSTSSRESKGATTSTSRGRSSQRSQRSMASSSQQRSASRGRTAASRGRGTTRGRGRGR